MSDKRVTGEIVFPEGAEFTGATVFVQLIDSGMMDTSASALAEQIIRNFSYRIGDPPLKFELRPNANLNEQAFLAVTAHISMTGKDDVEMGDYMTMQSYPVLNHGYPDSVTIEVRRV
jgi:uncharacterized lipoprotein YbaY